MIEDVTTKAKMANEGTKEGLPTTSSDLKLLPDWFTNSSFAHQ